MASGGRKQQDDDESGSWFSTGLKFAAGLGVAALGTYAVVKIAQNVAKEKEPPMPRSCTGGWFEDVAEGDSNAWSPGGESYSALGGSPESSESLTEREEPWCLSAGKPLENWYNENIQRGTDEFARGCRSAVDRVVRHVHRSCSSNILDFDVGQVVKGGSLGKGTMVKDLSDVDLVAFVNEPYLKPIAEIGKEKYKETLSRIISDVESTLQGVPNVKNIRSNDFLVNFEIKVGSRCIDVDLLPTTDNYAKPHQLSHDNTFRSMLQVGHGTRQFYSASFVQRQVRFVKEQPGHVKELIRLVKYWASKFLPKYLQKSYPLELITIHLWEKAGKPERRLSKAQGLRSVLETLANLEQLCISSWQSMYSDEDLAETVMVKLGMKRPIVLDPANPAMNVCYMYQWSNNIQEIAAAAKRTLRTDLLRNVTVQPFWRE